MRVGANVFEPQNLSIRKRFITISFDTVFTIGFDQIGHEKSHQTHYVSLLNRLELVSTLLSLFVKY